MSIAKLYSLRGKKLTENKLIGQRLAIKRQLKRKLQQCAYANKLRMRSVVVSIATSS